MTGILVAMEQEYVCLENAGIIDNSDCICALTGIGKANAAASATELILRHSPDCLISTGVAGGMLPEMNMMDIVIGERVAYHDVWCGDEYSPGQMQGQPLYYEADARLLEVAHRTAAGFSGKVYGGLICSGDQFFISMQEDGRIRTLYPSVLACDMESAAIAQTCLRYGVPCLCIRFISDVHSSEDVQRADYKHFLNTFSETGFDFIRKFIEYEKDS